MNRFFNWYRQWTWIENIQGKGNIADIVQILLDKPVTEFAGIPLDLREYRTYYKLNFRQQSRMRLASFTKNRVYRFASNKNKEYCGWFSSIKWGKVKAGLKSFQFII